MKYETRVSVEFGLICPNCLSDLSGQLKSNFPHLYQYLQSRRTIPTFIRKFDKSGKQFPAGKEMIFEEEIVPKTVHYIRRQFVRFDRLLHSVLSNIHKNKGSFSYFDISKTLPEWSEFHWRLDTELINMFRSGELELKFSDSWVDYDGRP